MANKIAWVGPSNPINPNDLNGYIKGMFYFQIRQVGKEKIKYELFSYLQKNDTFAIAPSYKKIGEASTQDELKQLAEQKLDSFLNLFI